MTVSGGTHTVPEASGISDIVSPMHKLATPFPALSETARSVVIDLLVHGPLSRADLARRAGMSPATLTRVARSLVDAGLITESDAALTQRTGRPAQPMDVNVDLAHLVGIKLSATQLNLVTTDMRARILSDRTIPLVATDPGSVTEVIARVVDEEVRSDPAIRVVGISLAGPVSPRSAVVRVSPFLDWSNVPLVDLVHEITGLPTVVENDVRALTAAEHWFGAAAGCSDFALVTIGSGVACGIVMDDRLIDGSGGGSGQIGHLPVTEWGPLCERGHRGCVRSYLSSGAIVGQVSGQLGRTVDYQEVLALAAAENPVARRVVNEAGRALGTVIGTIAAITAPSKVLVSGEGVGLAPLVMDVVRDSARAVQHWTLPEVPIEIAPFGFTEWAKGAAVIALRHQLELAIRTEA
jgi:predicted NBD/HSP70 family sugar kinase